MILVLPRFALANKILIEDMLGMKKGDRMLITTSFETPSDVVQSVMSCAENLGVTPQVLIADRDDYSGEPVKAVTNFAREFNGVYCMGGPRFDTKAVIDAGGKILLVGGGPGIDESLIRTIADVDVFKLRDESWVITEAFDKGSTLRITSKQGSDFTLEIKGALGYPTHGFASDPKGVPLEFEPPATPGVDAQPVLKDKAYGKIAFDAYLSPVGILREPVVATFEKGQITKVEGGVQAQQFWGKIKDWPEKYHAEIEVGTNPNARLVAPNGRVLQEWERVRGTVHIGMGDWMPYPVYRDGKLINPGWKPARHHCDGLMWSPTVTIDDLVIVKDGIILPPYALL